MTIAALVAAAMLVVAACDGEEEPVAEATPSVEAPTVDELQASIVQLQERVDAVEARLEAEPGLQERIEAVETRLDELDPSDLGSRVGEAEAEIERLSEAVRVLQAPADLGAPTAEPAG